MKHSSNNQRNGNIDLCRQTGRITCVTMATNQEASAGNTSITTKPQSQPDNDKKSSKNTTTDNDIKQQKQQQKQQQQQQQNEPSKPPKTETIRSLLLLSIAILDTYVLPGPTRTNILETVNARPVLSSFLAAQIAVALFPLLLFITGILTAGVVAAGLFACLGMVLLVPVLLVTAVLGVVIWAWGWGMFMAARWSWSIYVERTLGGPPTAVAVKSDDASTGNGNGTSTDNGNGNGGGNNGTGNGVVVRSDSVGVNTIATAARTNGESGKKWQFKAGFGDKWMTLG